jgi:hypothetical protein
MQRHQDAPAAVLVTNLIEEGEHHHQPATAGERVLRVGVRRLAECPFVVEPLALVGERPSARLAIVLDVNLDGTTGKGRVGGAGRQRAGKPIVGTLLQLRGDLEVAVDDGVAERFQQGNHEFAAMRCEAGAAQHRLLAQVVRSRLDQVGTAGHAEARLFGLDEGGQIGRRERLGHGSPEVSDQ